MVVWATANVHPLANSWRDQPLLRVNLGSGLESCATEHLKTAKSILTNSGINQEGDDWEGVVPKIH